MIGTRLWVGLAVLDSLTTRTDRIRRLARWLMPVPILLRLRRPFRRSVRSNARIPLGVLLGRDLCIRNLIAVNDRMNYLIFWQVLFVFLLHPGCPHVHFVNYSLLLFPCTNDRRCYDDCVFPLNSCNVIQSFFQGVQVSKLLYGSLE